MNLSQEFKRALESEVRRILSRATEREQLPKDSVGRNIINPQLISKVDRFEANKTDPNVWTTANQAYDFYKKATNELSRLRRLLKDYQRSTVGRDPGQIVEIQQAIDIVLRWRKGYGRR